jgi:Domain of unknown function (DUF4232)
MSVVAPPPQDEQELLIREARPRRRRRWLIGAAALATAAAGLSVSAPLSGAKNARAPARHVRGAHVTRCSPANLRISLPRRFAGLGHLNGDLRFTNTGGARCRLSGWPTVLAVEADGREIRSTRIPHLSDAWALNWPPSRPDRPVVLARDRSADVEIDGGDNPLRNASSCPAARWLRVIPPGGGRPVTLSAVWWRNGRHPVYYALCAGIAVTSFFPASFLSPPERT